MMIDKYLDGLMQNNPATFCFWTIIILIVVTEINYIIFLYLDKSNKIKEPWLNLKFLAIFFAIGECFLIIMLIMAFQYFRITLLAIIFILIIIIWLWLNGLLADMIQGKKNEKTKSKKKKK